MLRKYCTTSGRALTSKIIHQGTTSWRPTTHSLLVAIPRRTHPTSITATTTSRQTAFQARFYTTQKRFLSTIKEDVVSFSDDDSPSFPMNGTMGESRIRNTSHHSQDRDVSLPETTFLQVDSELNEQQQHHHHHIPSESTDTILRRQRLKASLANEVQSNVEIIIQQIDSVKVSRIQQQQQQPAETTHHPQRSSNQQGSIEKSLSRLWEVALRREMQGSARSHSEPGKSTMNRSSSHHATIDEIWDKAIQAAGIGHRMRIPNDFSLIDSPEHGPQEENQTDESNMPSSPIFGLCVDDLGVIRDHDIPETNQVDASVETRSTDQSTLVHDATSSVSPCQVSQSAIQACLALFAVTSTSDWNLFQSKGKTLVNLESLPGDNITHGELMRRDLAEEMLEYSRVHRLLLTTEECNLLIARLLASPTMDVDEILEKSLIFFNEMKRVAATGIDGVGPDATTYRLLFSALLRRLVATSEAAQICKTMASSSVKLNPQILLDAMKVCRAYGDLATASTLMAKALKDCREPSLTLQSSRIYIEMLQTKNKMNDARDFYDGILKTKNLQPADEDEVLLQLCRWPNRSRQGDTIDCASVLVHVKDAIFDKVQTGERPRIQLWFALLEKLARAEQLDPSLGIHINQTFRGMLKAYPEAWPGFGLLKIGLRAAEVTRDAGLIAALLARDITRKVANRHQRRASVQNSSDDTLLQQAPVPFMVFRKALQIAHRTLDTEAASTILEHYRHVDRDYPSSVKAEVYGLVIQTFALASKGEMAKSLLFSMIDDGMEPTEELTGVVLQSLASSGNADDARDLFNAMMEGTQQLPTPNVTSYNAILVAAINARNWEEALRIVDRMKENGVLPNSQTTQGFLLAHVNKLGTGSISGFMRQLLAERAPVDQATFTLAFRILHPSLDGNDIDDIRTKARAMGEKEPRLREASLKMVRSIRVAEVSTAKARNLQRDLSQLDSSESWMTAFSDLLEFTQQIDSISKDALVSQ